MDPMNQPANASQKFGVLKLLDSEGVEKFQYEIRKTVTTLGRALTNDVRLLLEDAKLYLLGANGIIYNGKSVKPSTSNTALDLSDGDVFQISKHLLSFCGYPEEKLSQSSSRSSDAHISESSSQSCTPVSSPTTPQRQSARLQARIQSPLLVDKSEECGNEQIFNSKNELGIMQQPDCDCEHLKNERQATSPSKLESDESKEEGHPQIQVQTLVDPGAEQSSSSSMNMLGKLDPAQKHDDAQSDLLPSSEKSILQINLAPQPSLMQDSASDTKKDNDENEWDDEDSEEAAVDLELSGVSSPTLLLESRVPQSLPRNLDSHRSLQWTPSRSRKVSLRTATLLKRSAQYPLVPLAELRRPAVRSLPSKVSPLGPRTSTGSRDMDITRDFDHNSDISDVSSDMNMNQYSSSESSESCSGQDHNEQLGHVSERAPTLAGFLTPQRTKQRNLRRMSNPEAPVTPRLRSRSSWQWLRSFFASPVRDSEKEPQDVFSESEQASQTQRTEELIAEENDKFHDVQENEPAVQHSESHAYEAMDIDAESSCQRSESRSPDTHPTTSSDTPDLRDLKHVFAMQPNALSVSPMADFRHLMRPDNNVQEDISLEAAWNTLTANEEHEKEEWSDVEEFPSTALEEYNPVQTYSHHTLGNHEQHCSREELDCPPNNASQRSSLPYIDSPVRSVQRTDADMTGSEHEISSLKFGMQDNAPQGVPSSPDTNSDAPAGSVEVHHTDQDDGLQIPDTGDEDSMEQISDKENTPSQTRLESTTRAMPVPSKAPGSPMSKNSDTKSLTPRRSPQKISKRDREPLRSSPRLKEAQKQSSKTHNIVTDPKATRMAARPVRHKEPYAPVRRQLPARSSIRQFRVKVDSISDSSPATGHSNSTKRTLYQGIASDDSDQSLRARGASSSIDDKARQSRAKANQR